MNQPTTTRTGQPITDVFDSQGADISVKIVDRRGQTVDSDAAVTLVLGFNTAGATLTGGGTINATGGVVTFPDVSVNKPGPFKLRVSSPVASNQPLSNQFLVADTLDSCEGPGCVFDQQGQSADLTVTPKKGVAGAGFATTLDLGDVKISCNFAPFNYPAETRQPNAFWYDYDDGNANSDKTNVLVIDKTFVQTTPENGASKYRICYASNVPFKDRTGQLAPPDPWGAAGPSAFFGETWYMGLLPDCAKKKPVAPCSFGFTATGAGDRIGTFLTPGGDPFIR